MAPADHRLDHYRQKHPLYDRRLPRLVRLIGEHSPGSTVIDVGANIGDTVALCRLEGADVRFLAVEASLTYLKYLLINRERLPELFSEVEPVWRFVGRSDGAAELQLRHGTAHRVDGRGGSNAFESAARATLEEIAASFGHDPREISLVKLDTDGFDHLILEGELEFLSQTRPVLWAEAETWRPEDEEAWDRILRAAEETWPYLVAFDNFGFACLAGRTAKKRKSCIDLMGYARRHRKLPVADFGRPTLHYLDIALFPERFASLFDAYLAELPELGAT
jgi:FkbM family methyltransferase